MVTKLWLVQKLLLNHPRYVEAMYTHLKFYRGIGKFIVSFKRSLQKSFVTYAVHFKSFSKNIACIVRLRARSQSYEFYNCRCATKFAPKLCMHVCKEVLELETPSHDCFKAQNTAWANEIKRGVVSALQQGKFSRYILKLFLLQMMVESNICVHASLNMPYNIFLSGYNSLAL